MRLKVVYLKKSIIEKFDYENLENIERVKEIQSKNIPKDRRLERLQIQERLRKKLDERKKR